jgi:hypothetical protein
MTRSRMAVVLLWLATLLTSGVAIGRDVVVEVVAKGVVTDSFDDTNALGYGVGNGAVGASVTLTFQLFAASVPTDIYGGARFPAEADYMTYGWWDIPTYGRYMPSWIESNVRFDNRAEFSSVDYAGNGYITDQVKIQDRAGGAQADHYGIYDEIEDEAPLRRGMHLGATFDEYVSKIVNGLAVDQRLNWRPNGDGSEASWGNFAIFDLNTAVNAGTTIWLKSYQVHVKGGSGTK